MANNYRHSGDSVAVATASAALTSGQFSVQEGFFGIVKVSCASGGSTWLRKRGVFNIPVPASTVKGDVLYVASLADAANPALTRTSASNFRVGIAHSDRDTAGNALVELSEAQKPAASA